MQKRRSFLKLSALTALAMQTPFLFTGCGGGGGGSSAQSIALFPAAFLPDVLSISVGVGGAGGSGGSGIASYVSVIENTTVNHLLMQATGGTGGGDGICVIICW